MRCPRAARLGCAAQPHRDLTRCETPEPPWAGRLTHGSDPPGGTGPDRAAAGLPHQREGRRDQELILLPDRPYAGLGRPLPATRAGGLPDAGALVEVLVYPGVHELVQPPELAPPAGRQG